jgi:hypothetical protein
MPISATYRPAITALTGYRVELDGWAAGMPGQDAETVKGVLDAQGTTWYLTNLEGWADGPPPRTSLIDRVGEHGSFDGPAYLDVRAITVEGVAVCTSRVATWIARDIIDSICGDPTLGLQTLKITQVGYGTWRAQVRRSGATKVKLIAPNTFRWSIVLVAPDPRRYLDVLNTVSVGLPTVGSGGLVFNLVFPLTFGAGVQGGQMALTNTGTINVWPTFTVLGPATAPVITNTDTGQRLEFGTNLVVAASQTLVVDTDAKTALLSGASRRADLLTAQWFPLPPGTTNIRFTHTGTYDANALLTATWRDGWT